VGLSDNSLNPPRIPEWTPSSEGRVLRAIKVVGPRHWADADAASGINRSRNIAEVGGFSGRLGVAANFG
jgi:hypothetical protein